MADIGARTFRWIVVALVGCAPLAPDARGLDATTTSTPPTQTAGGQGGAAREPTAVELFEHGLGLLNAGECAKAIREGFDPAIARFRTAFPDGAVVRAARSDDPAVALMRLTAADESTHGTRPGASAGASAVTGPDFPDAYFFRAFCFQALGRLSEAEASLRVALELMPGDTVYSCELGHLLHQRRDWEGALVRFDDAIQGLHELRSIHGAPTGASLMGMSLRDWHRRALRGRGFSLIELGRLDEAEAAYRQALALDANDTRAQTELNLIAHLRRQGLEPPGAFDDRAR